MYYLKTLGRLTIHPDAPERPPLLSASKSLAVLAYLSSYPDTTVSRDRIAGLFWPGADRSRARQSLRQALYYLSRKVGAQLVETSQRELAVRPELLEMDLWQLDRAVEAEDYERVLELHDGAFLAGVREKLGRELETWVEARNERVWTGVQAAYHRLVLRSLQEGDTARAIDLSRRYVELNPFHEDAQLALIRSLSADERPVAAVQAFESYRSLLREELDDEPGEELRSFVEELRRRVFRSPWPEPVGGGASGGEAGAAAPEAGSGGEARGAPTAPAPPEAPAGWSDRPANPDRDASAAGGRRGAEREHGAEPPATAGSVDDAWRPLLSASAVLALLSILLQADIGSGPVDARALPAGPWARAVTRGPPAGSVLLRPRGDSLVLEPARRAHAPLSRPGGGDPVGQVRTPRGYDLALLGEDGTARRILTSRPHDEIPLAWSPDGRLLVFQDGFLASDGIHYRRHLAVVELESGAVRPLSDLQTRPRGRAGWDPSGAWVVFGALDAGGDDEVFRVRPDGSDLRNLTRSPGFDGEPAWSPDGRWIAVVSERAGTRGIHLLDATGERVIPLVDTGFDEHQPVWLGPDRMLYLSTRGRETDVWLYDLEDEDRRRLTHRGDFRLLDPASDAGASPWIDELRIRPRHALVSPGQWLRLTVQGFGPADRAVPVPGGAVTWSASGRGVARREGEGLFRIEGTGRARIGASMPGWRSTVVEIESRPLERRKSVPLFHEAWADGIEERRWAVYGDPVPEVVEWEGRFRRTFRNNGDAHFDSGVASRARFPVRDGVTLEVWARVPLRNRHYQDLKLALVPDPAPPGTVAWSAPGATPLSVSLGGVPEGPRLALFRSGRPVPPPDSLDRWRRYALQVDEQGVPSLVVDGRLHWRGEALPPGESPDSVHIVLAGRTVGTDVLIGPVTLFRGARYTLR